MHYINQNIKWYREYKRYTQQELADILKTTLGKIKTYETAVATPPIEMIISISELMNITIDALVKVKLSEDNYLILKKDKTTEYNGFYILNTIDKRIKKIENKLKSSNTGSNKSIRKI